MGKGMVEEVRSENLDDMKTKLGGGGSISEKLERWERCFCTI